MSRPPSGADTTRPHPRPPTTASAPRPLAPDAPVGRAVELATLQHFIDDQSEPTLLLAGPRGSGRTWLLRRLHRLRPERTVLVSGRTVATSRPWTGRSAVLGAVGPRVADPALDVEPARVRRPRERMALTLTVPEALRRASTDPVVALVDDLDLQDEEGQNAMAVLAARLHGGPVRVLAAITWPALDDRYADLPMLRLDPLTDRELRDIAGTLPVQGIEPTTIDTVARFSGGVPGVFAAHLERLTSAQRGGRAPLTVPLPAAFPRETANAQVRLGLQAEEWELLQRIATAPAVSMDAMPGLVGPLIERLEPLIARGLVSRESGCVSVPLPELRSQLYWEMTSAARCAAHTAAAIAEDGGGDPDLRDWHRSHVALDPTTSSTLYAAGASMLRKGLTVGALEVAERALGLTGVGAPVQQQLEFARELMLHGCAELTQRHLPRHRATMTRRQLFQRARLELVISAFVDDDLAMEPVDALVGRYRAELPEECADLLALAGLLLLMDGALEEGVWRVQAAALLARPEPTGRSLHHWVDRLGRALLGGRDAADTADQHDRIPADADVETRVAAAIALMWEERFAAAREHFAIVLNGWHGVRSPWSERTTVLAIENEMRAGDLWRAAELGRRLERSEGRRSSGERLSLAWIAVQQQRFEDAEELLRSCEDDPAIRQRRLGMQSIARIRGTAALLQGDPEGAAACFRQVVGATADVNPAVVWCQPDLAEALWRLGDRAGATAVTDRLAEGVARAPSRWGRLVLTRCRAMLAEDAEAAFAAALVAFEGAELPFERARTHALAALAAPRSGRAEAAIEQQRAAAEAFGRIGATAWAELVRRPADAGVGSRGALPLLTDTELAVLRMARRGAHNREIAAALFMSLRSVELRLTQIYRKFDARSRHHLFTLLPAGWPDDGRSGSAED